MGVKERGDVNGQGAALIGLSPGQSMEWSGNDGKQRVLTVLAVSRPQSD